jgi:hypothetical protein
MSSARLFALLIVSLLALPARAADDPDTEVARRHFNQGRVFYDAGDYTSALREFELARRARPAPAFDYDIGRCNDRLERYPEAIVAYERYVSAKPPPPDADEVRARIVALKERVAASPTVPEKAPTPHATPTAISRPATTPTTETAPGEIPSTLAPSFAAEERPPAPKSNRRTVAIVVSVIAGAVVIGGAVALGLLLKPSTQAATADSLGGPYPGTK